MSRTFRKYGPLAAASLVVLALAAAGIAQPPGPGAGPGPGMAPTNAAVLGRGVATVPGYGAYAPYISTAPTLASGGAPFPSSSSATAYAPYSVSTNPGGATNPGYTAYYPPPGTYLPPAGAALQGLASLTSATGQYYNQVQQARITREQSYQASIDTQKKKIEYELWYETVRPTAPRMLAKEKATDIDWARNYAQNTEIWSGRTLNVLLKSIFASPSPTRGPSIPLDETTVQGLNLTDMTTRGNLALAKDEGKIDWPEALQEAVYDDTRERFGKNFNSAIKMAEQGDRPPIPVLRDLRADLKSLEDKLDDQVRDLPPSRYIESRRLLNKLKDTIKGLSDARICKSCNASWKKNVHTVADLVAYCLKNGLEFGPAATSADYPAYTAFYYALRSYERDTVLLAAR